MIRNNELQTNATPQDQLWIELAPYNGKPPVRLLVFLHGAGSTPEMFTPLALAWQFKFTGAAAIVLQGLQPGATGYGFDWFSVTGDRQKRTANAQHAAREVSQRINRAQQEMGLAASNTTIIGFSQGANLALELARMPDPCADIVVAHAGQLLRPVVAGQQIRPTIHLLHGEFDSLVLAQHSLRAYRALRGANANVSIDIVADGVHSIGQDMVNVGTTRMMQTLFQGRKQISLEQYGPLLTVSMDSRQAQEACRFPPNRHH